MWIWLGIYPSGHRDAESFAFFPNYFLNCSQFWWVNIENLLTKFQAFRFMRKLSIWKFSFSTNLNQSTAWLVANRTLEIRKSDDFKMIKNNRNHSIQIHKAFFKTLFNWNSVQIAFFQFAACELAFLSSWTLWIGTFRRSGLAGLR